MGRLKRFRKAKHLVEFALTIPIFMIILMVIIEYGYAMVSRLTVAEAIKMSLTQLNQLYIMPGDAAQKEANIEAQLTALINNYLTRHNVPFGNSVNVRITQTGQQTALVTVLYTYFPAFTLPNIAGGQIVPGRFNLTSTQVINSALLRPNSYNSFLTTQNLTQLNTIGTTSLNGILRDQYFSYAGTTQVNILERDNIALLVEFKTSQDHNARLFDWWGEDILPPNLSINLRTGTLEVRAPDNYVGSGNVKDTGVPYIWILAALGYTDAIFIDVQQRHDMQDYKINLRDGNDPVADRYPWCGQSPCQLKSKSGSCGTCDGDMTPTDIVNLPKLALSGLDSRSRSYASFEPVNNAALNGLYMFVFSRPGHVLKVYTPENAVPPASAIDPGSNVTYDFTNFERYPRFVEMYIDSDGDSIPDFWDADPRFFDVDKDGQLDGTQGSLGTKDTTMTSATFQAGYPYDDAFFAHPFNLDGTVSLNRKDSSSTSRIVSFTPQIDQQWVVTVPGQGLFFYRNANPDGLERVVPSWDPDPVAKLRQQSKFINGVYDNATSSIQLSPSDEWSKLTGANGPFATDKRIAN